MNPNIEVELVAPDGSTEQLTVTGAYDVDGVTHVMTRRKVPDSPLWTSRFDGLKESPADRLFPLMDPIIFETCSVCGNKRCPRNENPLFKCTGSNESGQVGELA